MNQLSLNKVGKNRNSTCAELLRMAQQELTAFSAAVKEMFGSEQAEISADDWLEELAEISVLPATAREWRQITIKASTRLARRMNISFASTVRETPVLVH